MLDGYIDAVRRARPLVHCMANYVTAGDCANALLAAGASPVMADAPEEVEEITAHCRSLVLNLGTLSERRLTAMVLAARHSGALGHPVVLDPVGVGASAFRRDAARLLLSTVKPTVIRGNLSEIMALSGEKTMAGGVDAEDQEESPARRKRLAEELARRTGSVVVLTGEADVVTDGNRTGVIQNGHAMMGLVTGTGCILSALIGAFLAADSACPLEAAAAAAGALGVCGERAYERAAHAGRGSGSYRMALMDELSLMKENIMGGVRLVSE